MPKLIIDGQEIEVKSGTKVIDAAERLGIMIPRFCYLKSLGAVGACRMCAVKFLEGHKSSLDMSCMVDAKDGMIVSTDHPEAVAFRAQIIEWLMLNHPHDCPVCDEGGHCLLQDMTVSGGHSRRNYRSSKRTYPNQDLGPLIAHEMNRCIHCYRCVRFYREYAGGTDYGTFGLASRVSYGRFEPGRLESPFAGNLGEICPTGTLTDKPFRYRARRWDLERAPSLCIHCGLGCNTLGAVRYREVLRVEARENPRINGEFLCDRGRYGFGYASLPNRPRQAMIGGTPVPSAQAVSEGARRLKAILDAHGPDAVAICTAPSCSLEDMFAASRMASALGCKAPALFDTESARQVTLEAATLLDREIVRDLGQIASSDCVLVLGADPLQEAPVAALAIRQASRRGATVAMLDPRPVDVLCPSTVLPLSRQALPQAVMHLLTHAFPDAETRLTQAGQTFWQQLQTLGGQQPNQLSALTSALETVAAALGKSKRPIVICSAELMPTGWLSLLTGTVRLLRQLGMDAGLCCLMPAANSLGAALLDGGTGCSLENIFTAIATGTVKGLICVGADPVQEFPREQWVKDCFAKLDTLLCLDCTPSATWNKAHVALPTTTVFESDGTYINAFGLLQQANPVFAGGSPITQTGRGSHPPRDPGAGLPGSEPRNAQQWCELLCTELQAGNHQLGPAAAPLAMLKTQTTTSQPVEVLPEQSPMLFGDIEPLTAFVCRNTDGEVLVSARTFGSDRLANYGELGQMLLPERSIFLHADDGEAFDLMDGDVVLLPLAEGLARGILRLRTDMARKTVVLPRIPEAGWQKAGGMAAEFSLHRLWKEQGDEDPTNGLTDETWLKGEQDG